MKNGVLALPLLTSLVLAGRLSAHEGHEHKVMGVVTAVDAAHVEIETREGEKVSIVLTKDTKVLRGKALAAVTDLKVGERVAVSYVEEQKHKRARRVLLSAAAGGGEPR